MRATSSTSTQRLLGWRASRKSFSAASSVMPCFAARAVTCFSARGVRTKPGQIALQVTWPCASSSATVRVMPMTPCLAAT
jgi:hypothetical protein